LSLAAWPGIAIELAADALLTLSALIALAVLVVLWLNAVQRLMALLLPPTRSRRQSSMRFGQPMLWLR
jgi:hypothetical protein